MISHLVSILVAVGPDLVRAWTARDKRRHRERVERYRALAAKLEARA